MRFLGLRLQNIFDFVKNFIDRLITHTDRSTLQQRIFEIQSRQESIPVIQAFLILMVVVNLITWPTDFMVFEKEQVIFWNAVSRIIGLCAAAGTSLLFYFSDKTREHVNEVFFSYLLVATFIMGYSTGQVAHLMSYVNPTTPWLPIASTIPFVSIIMRFDLCRRFLVTAGHSLIFVLGYFLTPMRSPFNTYVISAFIGVGVSIIVSTFIGHIVQLLQREAYFKERELKKERQKVRYLATYDVLTGLYNRRQFQQRLAEEYDRARRYDSELSLQLMDLDNFKRINDSYGHQTGDSVLRSVGELIQDEIRESDVACRYGGEEFALLLPDTTTKEAVTTAERLRQDLENISFDTESNRSITTTASFGIAGLADDVNEPQQLLRRADHALYQAKEAGRNTVILYSNL